jgi:predicted TIM-barrel fold metal-dependent hydrolase
MKFISCDPLIGLPRVPLEGITPTLEDLQGEMARLHIEAAIVRHRQCIDGGPYFGNVTLMDEISNMPALLPAWAITPDGREPDYDVGLLVEEMQRSGVKVAWLSPTDHSFSLSPWCCGELYEALSAARIPVLVEYAQTTGDALEAVCSAFPDLRLILFNMPRLGRNRVWNPLLKRHQNLYLCCGPAFGVHHGLKDLCSRFGHERWVLGTGYPISEGGSGIAGLTYAGLSDEATQAVASGNIQRLLNEVKHV